MLLRLNPTRDGLRFHPREGILKGGGGRQWVSSHADAAGLQSGPGGVCRWASRLRINRGAMGTGVYGGCMVCNYGSPFHIAGRARTSRLTGGVGGPDKASPSSMPEARARASQGHPAAKGGPPTRSSRPGGRGLAAGTAVCREGERTAGTHWVPLCCPPMPAPHSSLTQLPPAGLSYKTPDAR